MKEALHFSNVFQVRLSPNLGGQMRKSLTLESDLTRLPRIDAEGERAIAARESIHRTRNFVSLTTLLHRSINELLLISSLLSVRD